MNTPGQGIRRGRAVVLVLVLAPCPFDVDLGGVAIARTFSRDRDPDTRGLSLPTGAAVFWPLFFADVEGGVF
jgi:hypothetical protein